MGKSSENLIDVVNLALDFCNDAVHLLLMSFIEKWQRKDSNHTDDDHSKAIAQLSQERHQVHQKEQLEGVKKVSNKNEPLQCVNSRHSHYNGFLHVVVSLLSTQTDVQVQVRLEGMFSIPPAEDVEELVVDAH